MQAEEAGQKMQSGVVYYVFNAGCGEVGPTHILYELLMVDDWLSNFAVNVYGAVTAINIQYEQRSIFFYRLLE